MQRLTKAELSIVNFARNRFSAWICWGRL